MPVRRTQRSISMGGASVSGGGEFASFAQAAKAAADVVDAEEECVDHVGPTVATKPPPVLQRRKSVLDFGMQARAFNLAAEMVKGEDAESGVWTVRNTTVTSFAPFEETCCTVMKFVKCTFNRAGAKGKWTPPACVARYEFDTCVFPEGKAGTVVGFLNFPKGSTVNMTTCLLRNINVAVFEPCECVMLAHCGVGMASLAAFHGARHGLDAWKRSAEECH